MCQEEELIILYIEGQVIIENKNMNKQNTQEEQNFIQQMQTVKGTIFYMNHLDSITANNRDENFATLVGLKNNKFIEIHEGLDLSLKLRLLSALLEVYCTGNYEIDYIDSLEKDVKYYIGMSNHHIVEDCATLGTLLVEKASKKQKEESQRHEEKLKSIKEGFNKEHIDICESLFSQLCESTQNTEYYLKENGDVYYRIPSSA